MSNVNDYDFQLYKLADSFYTKYDNSTHKEILIKKDRPYNCIIFELMNEFLVCIPFRTEIKHSCSFMFKNSIRSKKNKSGLDYTKIVIISNLSYIDTNPVVIDQDEYKETIQNIERIQQEAFEFVNEYMLHVKGVSLLHSREFERRYKYSPLKYFHKELGV